MHVRGLDRHQRAKTIGGLNDYLGHQPRIQLTVIGENQDTFIPGILAPARNFLQPAHGNVGLSQKIGGAGREYFRVLLEDWIWHTGPLAVGIALSTMPFTVAGGVDVLYCADSFATSDRHMRLCPVRGG